MRLEPNDSRKQYFKYHLNFKVKAGKKNKL